MVEVVLIEGGGFELVNSGSWLLEDDRVVRLDVDLGASDDSPGAFVAEVCPDRCVVECFLEVDFVVSAASVDAADEPAASVVVELDVELEIGIVLDPVVVLEITVPF